MKACTKCQRPVTDPQLVGEELCVFCAEGHLVLLRPLVAIDTETTGVDVEKDRIIELGFAMVREPGGKMHARKLRLNPGVPIPPEATAVHGISDADVAGCPSFADVAEMVFATLVGVDITGFNARDFDVPIISAEFKRLGRTWPTPSSGMRVVDSYHLFKRQEPHDLANAARFYCPGVEWQGHTAAGDAQVALHVLHAQARRYGGGTVEELIALGEWPKDPDAIDAEGKLRWEGVVPVLVHGKHKGKALWDVPRDYLEWMTTKKAGYPEDTVEIIREALAGRYPLPPTDQEEREACGACDGRGVQYDATCVTCGGAGYQAVAS